MDKDFLAQENEKLKLLLAEIICHDYLDQFNLGDNFDYESETKKYIERSFNAWVEAREVTGIE